EALVERAQEVLGRVVTVLVDPLVAGRADVARLRAAQLPDDPVGAFDPTLHPLVDLRVLVEHLERLRELPLGRDAPAVAGQPWLAALGGELVDAGGVAAGGGGVPRLRGPG